VSTILQELHGGVARRHFSFDIIMRKILDAGYWWPTMNRDITELVINVKEQVTRSPKIWPNYII
jgi:hypothetical protein